MKPQIFDPCSYGAAPSHPIDPIGTIVTQPSPPSEHWIECLGQEVSEATYPDLRTAIGKLSPAPTLTWGTPPSLANVVDILILPDGSGVVAIDTPSRLQRFTSFGGAFLGSDISGVSLSGFMRSLARSEASGRIFASSTGGNRVVSSDDEGATWQPLGSTPGSNATQLKWFDDGSEFGLLVLFGEESSAKLSLSHDDGDTWVTPDVSALIGHVTIFGAAYNNGVLLLIAQTSTTSKYLRSEDSGATWTYGDFFPIVTQSGNRPGYRLYSCFGHFVLIDQYLDGWYNGGYLPPVRVSTDGINWRVPLLPHDIQAQLGGTNHHGDQKPILFTMGDFLVAITTRGILRMRGDGSHCSTTPVYPPLPTGLNWLSGNSNGYFMGMRSGGASMGRIMPDYDSNTPGTFYLPNLSQPGSRRWIKATQETP